MTQSPYDNPGPAPYSGGYIPVIPEGLADKFHAAVEERLDALDLVAPTDSSEPTPAAEEEGYVAMLREYLEEQRAWITPALRPLVFHLQRLGKRLDADPDAPVAMSSAYLQAFSRLDKNRPGGPRGDGLLPEGRQPTIFDEMDD